MILKTIVIPSHLFTKLQLTALLLQLKCSYMPIVRYLSNHIEEWLNDRMVFIGGPRQVGKTHLAKTFMSPKDGYYSWDDLRDRVTIKEHSFPGAAKTLVLDEIHKYPRWRTLLKGTYDKSKDRLKIIVTGSARLDHFRKSGDSLFGRYHYFRLHPLTLPEIQMQSKKDGLSSLLRFGGFPEPFLKQKESFAKIWRRERSARVFHDDLRDLTNLKDYTQLELLADLLPSKVGSLLSLNSLGEDLEKSPHTIAHWISILESIYHCYLVPPYGPPKVKALKKQQKLYLWDWSALEDEGAKFENFVASHLLKFCHFIEDTQGDLMELRFLKDQFGREVDFVVLKNKKPLFAVECKSGEKHLGPHLRYFKERTTIPKFFQVHLGDRHSLVDGIEVIPFALFCEKVGLV